MRRNRQKWMQGLLSLALLILAVGLLRSQPQGFDNGDLTRGSLNSDSIPFPGEDAAADGQLIIRPQPAYSSNQLRVSMAGSNDDLRVAWRVNGRTVGEGVSLDPMNFHAGDEVMASVEVRGDDDTWNFAGDIKAEILNSPPRLRGVVLERDPDTPGTLEVRAGAMDADEDPVTLRYSWRVDGQLIEELKGSFLSLSQLHRGQTVEVTVVASDGMTESKPVSAGPFEFRNSPPHIGMGGESSVETKEEGGRILICPLDIRDPDGDTIRVELVDAPVGVVWDASRGALVWNAGPDDTAAHIRVRVSDDAGGVAERDLQLSI